jgi:hypothetical protein
MTTLHTCDHSAENILLTSSGIASRPQTDLADAILDFIDEILPVLDFLFEVFDLGLVIN